MPKRETKVLVSVDKVSKRFGDFVAVDDVSFQLNAGQFLTILGPSGCGKSTLLRLIAGFMELSTGHILIDDKPVEAVPPHRRSIGMVFQRLALFPHMTVAENVAFPLKMRRFDPKTIPARVDRYLSLVQLKGYQNRRISELSGGQQQRVAIARALVFEPALLLLDEPLAALDKKLREEMQIEFRRIQRELGVTTINVTHDQREALVMSDRVMVMNDGRVQQFAAPEVAYQSPSNRFVADFIGMTNFFEGDFSSSEGAPSVEIANAKIEVDPRDNGVLREGARVQCAIRAHSILVGPDAERDADVKFKANIVESIFEGERLILEVKIPELNDVIFKIISHHVDEAGQLKFGANTTIGWKKEKLLLFEV
ncbi:ABC transporter ATP-binding protein [Mesorhizobium sp. CO1-1-11]|uniref:ABC transporter ATP-binding protein n=1 Tax=Mesorhizobium sp. CO1-1-11 TaxID=2876636 RepID=UPI00398D2353